MSTQTSPNEGSSATDCSTPDLQCWFGLSYASFLTLPRVLMEAMPQEWQDRMAELLYEYSDAVKNPPSLGTRVQITGEGDKLVKTPEWIINYRHPDISVIDQIMGRD